MKRSRRNRHANSPSFVESGFRAPPFEHLSGAGVRCLFLDMCGPGGGGRDFRLGADQLNWLRRKLSPDQEAALFLHSYPADLAVAAEAAALNELNGRQW